MSSRAVPVVVTAVAAALLLGPALGPGYVLTYDMVFVPRQSLLSTSVGLGDVLPRAVPQDAVLAALTSVAPGEVWQHLMLVGVVLGSGLGVARLLTGASVAAQCLGSILYSWSAFVVERLLLGSWPVLVAYAILPWALGAALALRQGRQGAGGRLVLLVALASLAPTGGLIVLALVLPMVVVGGRAPLRARMLTAAGLVALQLPWVVAAAVSPVAGRSDPAGSVFALRAEGPWGPLLTALGTGGAWSGDVVPQSRAVGMGVLATVVVVALAALGSARLPALIGRSGTATLVVVSLLGLGVAVVAASWPAGAEALVAVPGAGLVRDGQRLLAPVALLLALAAALGAARLLAKVGDRAVRTTLAVSLVVLPILLMPDAAWGAGGRLSAVAYPPDWQQVRDAVATSTVQGDVAVLPMGAFRQFRWNGGRTVLDPAPRWLPRPSVVDDRLLVGRPDGSVVEVAGESQRAREIRAAIAAGEPILPTVRAAGVGLVLVEAGQPGEPQAGSLVGLRPVLMSPGLRLYEVPGGATAPQPAPWRVMAVGAAWGVTVVALAWASVVAAGGVRARRVRNSRTAARRVVA